MHLDDDERLTPNDAVDPIAAGNPRPRRCYCAALVKFSAGRGRHWGHGSRDWHCGFFAVVAGALREGA